MWLHRDQQVSNAARTPEEVAFLRAVEFSDVTTVRRLLGENPHLNVDAIDALGRTALRLAVRNENRELVEVLLEQCSSQNLHEAALQSISEDHTSIAELILRHPSYLELCRKRQRLGDMDGFFKTEVESQFSTDITPVNLAAQKNNYAIVQLLLLRGERIQKPHKFSCGCQECRNRVKFDQLRMANFRLNAYRGLASEAYISLSSEDPFLTAFQLAKELRTLSNEEKHFKKEYKDLANNLSNYLVRLLDKVWTQDELEVVLNKSENPDVDRSDSLSRLKMALDQREKKFVSHPSVQQHIVRIWHQGLYVLDTDGLLLHLAFLTGLVLVYPFLAIAHLVRPDSKWTKLAKQPMIKFMGHNISYFVFLLLIIISSTESMNMTTLKTQYAEIAAQYLEFRELRGPDKPHFGDDFPLRPLVPTVVKYLMTIWIAGMLVQELQQIADVGFKAHFRDLFNVLDYCVLAAYTSVFVLFYWTLNKSTLAISDLKGKNASMMLKYENQTWLHFYWLNEDRMMWDKTDPINIAEGLFAFANILSFTRICYLLQANESVGPMQISLGRMINDIMQFLVFICIALVAFIVSLRNLYYFYSKDNPESKQADNTDSKQADNAFNDMIATFRTVFWWIYGRGELEALKPPEQYAETGQIAQELGQWIAAAYHMAIVLVLFNLLIAMMARSFEKTLWDVDCEWKYARTMLYMEYISPGHDLPVPFNLLEPLRDFILWLIARCRLRPVDIPKSPTKIPPRERRLACFNIAITEDVSQIQAVSKENGKENFPQNPSLSPSVASDNKYKDTIQILVQRYIFDIQREVESGADDVDVVRQTIARTKAELMDMIDKQGESVLELASTLKMASSKSFLNGKTKQWNCMDRLSYIDEEDESSAGFQGMNSTEHEE